MTDWTRHAVENRVIEAAVTLRRLPPDRWSRLNALRVSWPDYVKDRGAYGYNPTSRPRILPSSAEIDRLDEVMAWIGDHLTPEAVRGTNLPSDIARIVWLRAARTTWPRISIIRQERYGVSLARGGPFQPAPRGNTPKSLRNAYHDGLDHLAAALRRLGVPFRPVPGSEADTRPARAPGSRAFEGRVDFPAESYSTDGKALYRVRASAKPGRRQDGE